MILLGHLLVLAQAVSFIALLTLSSAPSIAAAQTASGHESASPTTPASAMRSPTSTPTPAPASPLRRAPRSAAKRTPAAPRQQTSVEPTASNPDALLREYEIRLRAHQRELLEREAELERARREIASRRQPPAPSPNPNGDAETRELERSERASREEVARLREKTRTLEAQLRSTSAALPTPSSDPSTTVDKALIDSLQRELEEERENRTTLETEIQRLSSEPRSTEELQTVSQSLDRAHAELLVLNQRLAGEQKAREALEVTIERMRQAAGVEPGNDWFDRFQATMKERHEQAERLGEELRAANEMIVALKGQLESTTREGTASLKTAGLENEIEKLKEALAAAQQANADLRVQAELASRLAELLYGQSR
jgi:hypothetical protein